MASSTPDLPMIIGTSAQSLQRCSSPCSQQPSFFTIPSCTERAHLYMHRICDSIPINVLIPLLPCPCDPLGPLPTYAHCMHLEHVGVKKPLLHSSRCHTTVPLMVWVESLNSRGKAYCLDFSSRSCFIFPRFSFLQCTFSRAVADIM